MGEAAFNDMPWQDLQRIRQERPLVHNITNYVVMHSTANALLALGASPVMAHAAEEVEDMVHLARALVINIGTLSPPWIESMLKAGTAARRLGKPVVLDPVGCGATPFRTATAQRLLKEIRPTIVRGNASEIRALVCSGSGTKGVDSTLASEDSLQDAKALSRVSGCVVSVSGQTDVIVQGETVGWIANGHSVMTRVTGMGCIATAITAAFAAVNSNYFQAAVHAMAIMGIAGEMAAARSQGPGTFPAQFLDALDQMQESDLTQRLQLKISSN